MQRLFVQGLGRYGCMGVGLGAMLVGDKLYGYRGGLLARVEGVGWLPVVWVVGLCRRVGWGERVVFDAVFGWAFGCQRACGVCSRLLEMADASGSPTERGEPRTGSVPPARRGEARRGWVNLTRAGRWART